MHPQQITLLTRQSSPFVCFTLAITVERP